MNKNLKLHRYKVDNRQHKTKDIRLALTSENTINQDLETIREKCNASEEDMEREPQNPFAYLRETFKDTAFRTSLFYKALSIY